MSNENDDNYSVLSIDSFISKIDEDDNEECQFTCQIDDEDVDMNHSEDDQLNEKLKKMSLSDNDDYKLFATTENFRIYIKKKKK